MSKRKIHSPHSNMRNKKSKVEKKSRKHQAENNSSPINKQDNDCLKGFLQAGTPVYEANVGNEIVEESSSQMMKKQDHDFLNGFTIAGTPISGVNVLSDVSNETVKPSSKRKRKPEKNSTIIKRIKVTNTVIDETPVSSLASAAKTFYCSQSLYESVDPYIMQNIVPSIEVRPTCSTQVKISECSTSCTGNDSRTMSGLDIDDNDDATQFSFSQRNNVADNFMNLKHDDPTKDENYVMSQLYDSQKLKSPQNESTTVQDQEFVMTQLYNSHSIQQISSNVVHETAITALNSTNDCESEIPENSSGSNKNDCLSPSSNQQINSSFEQLTPIRSTDVRKAKKKISFEPRAETYYDDASGVEDNVSQQSLETEVSQENNTLPEATVTNTALYSMINNPPTEFMRDEASCNFSPKHKETKADYQEATVSAESTFETPNFDHSFPTTPVDENPLILPPSLLLSNYCSEYDKAYTMKDLKPNQYRNYRHSEALRELKEHLDNLIPPGKSLREHYKINNLP